MRTFILLAIIAAFSGCVSVTGSAMKKLQPGMAKDQALKITGKADGYRQEGFAEIYTFTDRPIDINSPNRADYQVVFVNGKVKAWGPVEVRKTNVGMMGVVGTVYTN